ncbi:MAG: NAD-dependent epimerase/dehydratase family protein [Rhodospirillales bacterium]|nr:NAD-dependent epimerase/dehydratase family protein [Rhodospirillales bacterium]
MLGGTGLIGSAIVRELARAKHDLIGLARSRASASRLKEFGASVLMGDIRHPERWVGDLPHVHAVVQVAADFDDDMGAAETKLLDGLLPVLGAMSEKPRFVYTGGCWLYGATGSAVATEATPFNPLPAFSWMVPNLERVLAASEVGGLVVHPAMVYTPEGGVLTSFIMGAREGVVRVVGDEAVHWPVVHADDLAELYALVLERGIAGSMYNGAAVEGVAVGTLARAVARRYGGAECKLSVIGADEAAAEGEWARGYALDQRMSGDRARRELGWRPIHLDPVEDILQRHALTNASRRS